MPLEILIEHIHPKQMCLMALTSGDEFHEEVLSITSTLSRNVNVCNVNAP